MRTSKPISTISYNTDAFLKSKLNELVQNKIISNWIYMPHWAEEIEKSEHKHVTMNPNKIVDTMMLQAFFMEVDPKKPLGKPLGCIDFRLCKIDDWILYTEHFEAYLISKNEQKEFAYSKDDFVYYDEKTFEYLYNHAHYGSDWAHRQRQIEMLRDGADPIDLINSGAFSINQSTNLRSYEMMARRRAYTKISPAEKKEENEFDKMAEDEKVPEQFKQMTIDELISE